MGIPVLLTLRQLHDAHTDPRHQVSHCVVPDRVSRKPGEDGQESQDETLHPGAGTSIGGRAAIGRVEEKHGTGLSCSVYGALLGRHHVVVPSEICVYKSGMVYNTP